MRANLPATASVQFFGFDENDTKKTFGISVYIGDDLDAKERRVYTPLHERIHMTVRDMIQKL